jgi:RND family efflux transporter MFP subunit
VLITAGDVVTVGQPLVELDQSTLRVQLDQVRLDIESSRLRSERARLDFERLSKLGEQKFVNTKELQDAEIAYKLSRTDAESQQARVRLLENSLGKAVINAPYAGTVLNVVARPGMVVTGADAGREGVALLEVADLSQLRVEATINEIDVASLSLNQPVEVTFESVPEARATGRVSFVSPAAKSTGTNSNAAKEFPLQIAIESAHPRVKPGMTARVHIETARVEKAISVDAAVVFYDFDKDESYVFVRPAKAGPDYGADAGPVKRVVTLGVRGKEHVEIKSGLAAGEEVSRQRPPAVREADAKSAKKDKSNDDN